MYYSVKMMMGLNDYFAQFTVMESESAPLSLGT